MEPGELPFDPSRGPAGDVQSVAGEIERVTYHDEESGFCVLRVRVPGQRELATVVGRTPVVAAGQHLRAEGEWVEDPKHGRQLKARQLALAHPVTPEGAERYLASGQVPSVGPELARRLVAAFGERVFDVIERSPARLREVEGVGAVRAERIARGFREGRNVRELMVFLQTHGIGPGRAVKIHRLYGEQAIERIRSDPYALARDVHGIGFPTADALARSLGTQPDAPQRLRAALHHVLEEAQRSGHCGLEREALLEAAAQLVGQPVAALEVPLAAETTERRLVADDWQGRSAVFDPALHAAERDAAERVRALASAPLPWAAIDAAKAIPWVEERLAVELAPSQRDAVAQLLGAKLAVLTGGPGVGKTTLVRALLRILRAKKVKAELAAPTGRAAKRLADASGAPARTLHRLLEAEPGAGFRRNASRPLDLDLLVVDECSMVDVPLFAALLRALPRRAALLLVGDAEQLPPVGPGQPFADLIATEAVPVVRLRELFRQAEASAIVRAAHALREGELPELTAPDDPADSDFFFIEARDPERAAERVVSLVAERIPQRFGLDPIDDVQVLSPMQRGSLGARSLNAALQRALGRGSGAARVERGDAAFSAGDKVMQLENDYDRDVYNGDVGRIESVDVDARELSVRFDERSIAYTSGDLDALSLAYAITIHKSQGSEYPAVVIPLSTQHYPMLRRDLVYTAITRGKRLVVMVGEKRALSLALRADAVAERISKLRDWLAA